MGEGLRMSQQLAIACANIGCHNSIYRQADPQSQKRFCRQCQIGAVIGKKLLRWKCSRCDRIISDQNVRKTTCEACKQKRKTEYMKNYRQVNKIILKIKRMQNKKCNTCHGRFFGSGVFCGEYCKWIKSLKSRHYKIILRLEDICG